MQCEMEGGGGGGSATFAWISVGAACKTRIRRHNGTCRDYEYCLSARVRRCQHSGNGELSNPEIRSSMWDKNHILHRPAEILISIVVLRCCLVCV